MNRAVFIDKDGTLVPDVPYNVDPALIRLEDHAAEGLRDLQQHGYLLVIISNQAGVAKGYFAEEALEGVEKKISELLYLEEIELSGFYYCPHCSEGVVSEYVRDCDCRKPKPGMIQRAAAELDICLEESWMVGDILNDVEAGHRAGCRSILIDNNNETEWLINDFRNPDYRAKTINEAAAHIIHSTKPSEKHEHRIPSDHRPVSSV